MADTTAAARAKLDQIAKLLGDPKPLVIAGSRAGKQAATVVAGELGPLRHMGRGVTLRVRDDVSADNRTITIALRPAGAWVITEQGAKEHDIRPRRGSRHQVFGGALFGGGRPAVTVKGQPVAVARGASARGRRGIARAFAKARPAIPAAIHEAQVQQMRRIYG